MQYNNNTRKNNDTPDNIEYIVYSQWPNPNKEPQKFHKQKLYTELAEFIVYTNGLANGQKIKLMKILYRFGIKRFTRPELRSFLEISDRQAYRYLAVMRDIGLAERVGATFPEGRSIYQIVNNPKHGVDCRWGWNWDESRWG